MTKTTSQDTRTPRRPDCVTEVRMGNTTLTRAHKAPFVHLR